MTIAKDAVFALRYAPRGLLKWCWRNKISIFYGWAGANLKIDLSSGEIEREQSDPKLLEAYLAGKGTNAKILWDKVPPEVDAFSANNLLIIGVGVLTGTLVPAANRAIITFKSPVTDMHAHCGVGGFFGPELKHAGYDTITISGKSAVPTYLWIRDDHVEIRNAGHLWGKDTWETQRLLREELKEDKVQILCIGPAGENRVYMASIEGSGGVSASRGGVGAIMGDKKLKAIVVRGMKDINIAKESKLIELGEYILNRVGLARRDDRRDYMGKTARLLVKKHVWAMGHFSGDVAPHVQRKVEDDLDRITRDFTARFKTRNVSCYNCPVGCRWMIPDPYGEHFLVTKCQALSAAMIHSQVIDCDIGLRSYSLCRKYGLDLISVLYCVAFAIGLYREGILTKEDTQGMYLEWGNAEVFLSLVKKIARREGIGDVLANGAYRAAQQISRGAEDYVCHTKKLESLPVDYCGRPDHALPQAISDKADRTRNMSATWFQLWKLPKEDREAYLRSGFFEYPKEYKKHFLADYDPTGVKYEGLCQFLAYDEETFNLADATGCCLFWLLHLPYAPITPRSLLADLTSCATGIDIDEIEATKIARRIMNLVRAYNARAGAGRKDDSIPKIFFGERSRIPPHHQLDYALFNKWLDRYYEIEGWNSDGIPTKETLDKLDLNYVREDLERRGILTSEENKNHKG